MVSNYMNSAAQEQFITRSSSIAIKRPREYQPQEKTILYNEERYTLATWMMYSRIAQHREQLQSRLEQQKISASGSSSSSLSQDGDDTEFRRLDYQRMQALDLSSIISEVISDEYKPSHQTEDDIFELEL